MTKKTKGDSRKVAISIVKRLAVEGKQSTSKDERRFAELVKLFFSLGV